MLRQKNGCYIFFLFRILLLVGKSEIENIIYFTLYIFGIKKMLWQKPSTQKEARRRTNSLNFLYFFFSQPSHFFDVEQKKKEYMKALKKKLLKHTYIKYTRKEMRT